MTDELLMTRAREMLDELDISAILITRSEKGMLLVDGSDQTEILKTRALEVYDVTGAGDTVIAVMAAALASGESLRSAAQLSNLAAGLVVGKIGVASVTPSELQVALHRRGQGGRGLVSEDELLPLVNESRERNERIVMTNGCFDVLHAGHVAYLEAAKSLGDRLIVAINDDESVRRLKGESRPVNELQNRMAVLAGLASVDWVVPFSEDTPERLIGLVLPDVLVKGGDYRADEIAGAKDVLKNGGEVRVLAYQEGQSSSRIIDKLRG
jgi:D-beta-D-heptose 7-phosphate kinase/D-beta-D-heptose 1-phosphate adenosyltransferase